MKFANLYLRLFINTDLQKDILFLKSIELFKELSILQLKKMLAIMYKKTYIKKEVIYKKGQEANLFCIVRSGKIELDDETNKQIIQKRELFGKQYVFNDSEVYTNTATAMEDSVLFLMHKSDFELLLEKDKMGFNIFKRILKMLYEIEKNER